MFRRIQSYEPGGETDIGEVDLRGFYDSFGDVREIGWQLEYEEGRFKNRYPFAYGRRTDPRLASKRCKVDNLSNPSGKECHESLEEVDMLNIDQLSQVAFDIGLEIIPVVA